MEALIAESLGAASGKKNIYIFSVNLWTVLILGYSGAVIYDAGNHCDFIVQCEFGDCPIRHHLEKLCRVTKTIKVFLIYLPGSLKFEAKIFLSNVS